jgi:Na+/proline symporter
MPAGHQVYRHLKLQSAAHPIDGNLNGSALTMVSRPGLIFGIINVVGNFGTVFVDQVGSAGIGSSGHCCMVTVPECMTTCSPHVQTW